MNSNQMDMLNRTNQIMLKKALYKRMEINYGTDDLRTALYLASIKKNKRDYRKKYIRRRAGLFMILFYYLLVAVVILIQEVVFK